MSGVLGLLLAAGAACVGAVKKGGEILLLGLHEVQADAGQVSLFSCGEELREASGTDYVSIIVDFTSSRGTPAGALSHFSTLFRRGAVTTGQVRRLIVVKPSGFVTFSPHSRCLRQLPGDPRGLPATGYLRGVRADDVTLGPTSTLGVVSGPVGIASELLSNTEL